MHRSTKALLLSALVFPGAGHWYLAKRWQAIILILAACAALFVLVSNAMTQANRIAERILSGEVQPELGAIMQLMTDQGSTNESKSMTIATALFAVAWVVGIVGSWLAAKTESFKE